MSRKARDLMFHELQELRTVCADVEELGNETDAVGQVLLHVFVVQPQHILVLTVGKPRDCRPK